MALTEDTGIVKKRDEFYLYTFLRKVSMEEYVLYIKTGHFYKYRPQFFND